MRQTASIRFAAVALCLALTGCFGASTPIQYYTLTTVTRPVGLADGGTGAVVAVLPILIPAGIDRPQIVTRSAANQLSLSEYHRWGGSLREDVGRALVQNLNGLLTGRPVSVVPETLAIDARYSIAVTVNRLDGRLGETVGLNAGWTLRDQRAKKTLAIRSFVAEERVTGTEYADLVSAKSRLVEALSREIATELERKILGTGDPL